MDRTTIIETLRAVLTSDVESDEASDQALTEWRERIDLIDSVIVELLNERSRSANEIGHIKKELGLPVYVPSREEEVIRLTLERSGGPLPDHAVRRIFERIIDETRSLERQRYQDPESDGAPDS